MVKHFCSVVYVSSRSHPSYTFENSIFKIGTLALRSPHRKRYAGLRWRPVVALRTLRLHPYFGNIRANTQKRPNALPKCPLSANLSTFSAKLSIPQLVIYHPVTVYHYRINIHFYDFFYKKICIYHFFIVPLPRK